MDGGSDSHRKLDVKRRPNPVKNNGPQVTLPRLKKIKRDLLRDLSLDSHECQHEILPVVYKSFHFPVSKLCYKFTRVQSVHNPDVTEKYLEKRREMKGNNYPDALVADTFAFIPVSNFTEAEKMCKDGIRCGNQSKSGLGVPHMAIHVCKHADVLTPSRPKPGEKLLLVVKVLKGKMKTVVCKGAGAELEPTPNYDCHAAKAVDQSILPKAFFYSSQLYVYEYGDFDLEDYPRQVLPYALITYTLSEPQTNAKTVSNVFVPTMVSVQGAQTVSELPPPQGPSNEVWRGRLHVKLVGGGHIYIDVNIFSYFVPLTVTLLSPIKIHGLYPEHNAQFTFFAGLTNIAEQGEVEWREHYIRSCIMRPRPNNEEHFSALVRHITAKREMPTVRLPNDVFLFLMPNCLLASQLGLRWEHSSPVLHCVIMSKFSTVKSQKKKLSEGKTPQVFHKYGHSSTWESMFDDSDFSDEEQDPKPDSAKLTQAAQKLFEDHRLIHNKFAAMSLADSEANFVQCGCHKVARSQYEQQSRRDSDVCRVFQAVRSAVLPQVKSKKSHFPPGSRHKPKQKLSRRARAMPSFSPHGSSESDSDDLGQKQGLPRVRKDDHLSLLKNDKTVEEELSEEDDLTTEQMEAIIFMRKPMASTSKLTGSKQRKPDKPGSSSASSIYRSEPKIIPTEPTEAFTQSAPQTSHPDQQSVSSGRPPKVETPSVVHKNVKHPVSHQNQHKSKMEKPPFKAGSTEKQRPVKPPQSFPTQPLFEHSIKLDIASTPVTDQLTVTPVAPEEWQTPSNSMTDGSVYKVSSSEISSTVLKAPVFASPRQQACESVNLFEDIDMRVSQEPYNKPVSLDSSSFWSIPPPHPDKEELPSPNLSWGTWRAPEEIYNASIQNMDQSEVCDAPSPVSLPDGSPPSPDPSSPPSPPSDSPASPVDSPASPPPYVSESPASPLPIPHSTSESPASPPSSTLKIDPFRSTPIAIPTDRVHQDNSPEISFSHLNYSPTAYTPSGTAAREGIYSVEDMKEFLNSGVDMELDTSYEDER